ncbi:MAG: GUN4 domain-containing protein [Trichodesmium sp. St4_bin8_1]|nr:GUN4 domain-containing protein [Trichodesmium sp. St4_bin8_1]
MKFILWAIILAFLALTLTSCSLPPDQIASRLEPSLVKVFYKNQPGHGTGFFVPGETGVCKVLTAAHVVNKEGEKLLQTKDGNVWDAASVEMFSDDIDLALVTFEPEKEKCDYPTLKIGNSEDIKQGSSIYISGLSSRDGKMLSQFVKGNVTALNVFPQGYRVSYQGLTVAGMSGAPVIDERGKVVAVHGMSDVETVKGFSSLKTSWPELELQTTWQAEEVVNTAIKHLTFSWGIPISFFRESPFYYDSGDIYGLSWWIFLSGAGIVAVSFIYVGFRYLNVSPLIAEVNNLKTQLRDEEDKGEEVQKELKSLKNSYKGLERKLEAEISERYEAEEQIQTLQVVVEKQKQLEMQLEIEMSTRCQVEEQIQTLQVAAQKERELERQLEFESQNTEDKSGVDLFLVSEVVGDYTKLRDLLAAKQWREADLETYKRMLEVAGRNLKGSLRVKDVYNFPCKDLVTINELWIKYSDGKFGLSVQKQIYESMGGTKEYDYKVIEDFGNRVGWRQDGKWLRYHYLTFSEKYEMGCLPVSFYLERVASLLFAGMCKFIDCDL